MTCPRSGPCKWSWDLNSGQTEPRHPVRPLCEPCEGAGGLRARSEEGLLEDGMPALDLEGRAETRLHEFDIAWNRGKWPGWPEGRHRAEQSQRGSDLPSSTSSSHSTASDPGADPPHACPDSLVASERPRGLASPLPTRPPPSHPTPSASPFIRSARPACGLRAAPWASPGLTALCSTQAERPGWAGPAV